YMAGRLRTGSSPSSTWIECWVVYFADAVAVTELIVGSIPGRVRFASIARCLGPRAPVVEVAIWRPCPRDSGPATLGQGCQGCHLGEVAIWQPCHSGHTLAILRAFLNRTGRPRGRSARGRGASSPASPRSRPS